MAEGKRDDASEEGVNACAPCNSPVNEPVFAVGSVSLRVPSASVQREYEFERATLPGGKTEYAYLIAVLKQRPDLARLVCWVLSTQGIERYYLRPRTERELQALIDAPKSDKSGGNANVSIVVGWLGGTQSCAGVELPTVLLESSYHFELGDHLSAMSDALGISSKAKSSFVATAKEAFGALVNTSGNNGLGRFRALNWIAVRFAPLYDLMRRAADNDEILQNIEARHVASSGTPQQVVDVVLSFQPRKFGSSSRYRIAIDISDLYPYPLGQTFSQAYD